jgi:hypothetical protein
MSYNSVGYIDRKRVGRIAARCVTKTRFHAPSYEVRASAAVPKVRQPQQARVAIKPLFMIFSPSVMFRTLSNRRRTLKSGDGEGCGRRSSSAYRSPFSEM